MKVSIVINTYNRAQQLQDCLRSLWNLEYDEFEVIVVNGPSTDATKEICEQYGESLIYVDCADRNLSISRNIGIANSSGDIVAFIDDDAVVHSQWLRKIVDKYVSPDIFGVGGFTIDHTGKQFQATTTICDRLGDAYAVPSGVSSSIYGFKGSGFYPSLLGTNSSFRLSALREIGGFDETFAYFLDETDVCLRLIDHGGQIVYASDAFIYHRYAPSHLRNPNKVPISLFIQTRSKAYFMCRHGRAAIGNQKVEAAIVNYQAGLRRDNEWLEKHGHLSQAAEGMLNLDVELGIEEGRKLALLPAPTNLSKHEFLPKREFKKFIKRHQNVLRIALVSQGFPPNDTSGIARWTHHVAYGLAKRGYDVHVITRASTNSNIDYKDGVWIHSVQPSNSHEFDRLLSQLDVPANLVKWSIAVYEELRNIGFDNLDLVSAPIWDVEGLVPLLMDSIPVVTSLHTTYKLALPYKPDWKNYLYNMNHVQKVIKAERYIFEHGRFFLGNTVAVVNEIDAAYGVDISERTSVVAHGVDGPVPGVAQAGGNIEILFVGRRETRKGFDTALHAATIVCSKSRNITFRFIGAETDDKISQQAIINWFDSLSDAIACRISIEGYIPDAKLHEAYRNCSVFLAPSRFESFGLIAIEAMRYGKPVIAGNVGGLVEVVDHEVTGLLVDPDDANAIADAILRLGANHAFRKKLGMAAEDAYRQRFTVKRMIDGIEEAYISFLKNSPRDEKFINKDVK
jgi:hypothetical protein